MLIYNSFHHFAMLLFVSFLNEPFAGHSNTAHQHMKTLQVGVFDGPSKKAEAQKAEAKKKSAGSEEGSGGSGSGMGKGFIMFIVVAVAIAGYFVMGKSS